MGKDIDVDNWQKVKEFIETDMNAQGGGVETTNSLKFILGEYFSYAVKTDIKHMMFTFSRYKFAAKMIENRENCSILELGCNEGLGTLFFKQIVKSTKKIVGVDLDSEAINWSKKYIEDNTIHFIEDNFINKKYGNFDVIVSLDVIEHIDKSRESDFVNTIDINLDKNGIAIIGTPSKFQNQYASQASKIAHINLYDQRSLYRLLSSKFTNVFIFGMNDELIHTGLYPMCSYIIALCCGKK